MKRLWDKGKPVDELILKFTVGEDYLLDERLVHYDVQASIAHVTMLEEQGYLSPKDAEAIRKTLNELAEEHARGEWAISLEEEDCHTALENRLIERLGEVGGRVHLGRSRNDQVLAALRLYLLDAVEELRNQTNSVAQALDELARKQGSIQLPGYTHMQRAMPSTVELWASGFSAELRDDAEGLAGAKRRLAKNPLGSAAGYGTPGLELDRKRTASLLGFEKVHNPATAVQLSRGKAEAGVLFEISLLMQDLGRLSAELCLFATAEFGFVKLPEEFTTGSSIMPQKRNPDIFELVRGRSALAAGDLVAALNLTLKMTSGYHRDLQLLKPPLFRGIDSAMETLEVMARAITGIEFVQERCEAAMDPGLFAAERAFELVKTEGISFREAYRRIAQES